LVRVSISISTKGKKDLELLARRATKLEMHSTGTLDRATELALTCERFLGDEQAPARIPWHADGRPWVKGPAPWWLIRVCPFAENG